MTNQVDLVATLGLLGYTADEHVAICTQLPGQAFIANCVSVADADTPPDDRDAWFSVNPVPAATTGRGTADEVTRFAAVYADLDVKPGGLPDMGAAAGVVATLADMLGTHATIVTASGHGLQPIWAIDPADGDLTTPEARARARRLLRQFGRLVAGVADRHGGTCDPVYDLARVLRIPGTVNHKADPVAVVSWAPGGSPLTLDQLTDTLDAYRVTPAPEDDDDIVVGHVVAGAGTWPAADHTCGYVARMVAGWADDTPTARHPWLVSAAVRLAAAARSGCITAADHAAARSALADRFTHLCATGAQPRRVGYGEIPAALAFGTARVERMTDTGVHTELGNHVDLTPPTTGSPATPAPATISPGPADTTTTIAAGYGATEDGTARALVAQHADTLRYCPQRGRWLTWTGHRWAWDDAEHVRELTRNIARRLPEGKAWSSHKRRALSAAGVTGIIRLAQTDPAVTVNIDHLDAHPYQLNTPTGIIDLRTGRLHPPDPTALHTRSTPVAPDFDRPGERFTRFLRDTFTDNDLLAFVARLAGLAAIGKVLEQLLPFSYGTGANGKSTLAESLQDALGRGETGYAISAPAEMLMTRRHTEHPTELAQLAGARLVVCSELDDGQRFAEAKIKQLTGGDSINARFMRRDPFTFTPTHTLWLLGNHRPHATTGGPAFWRRIHLIPFTNIVPETRRDPRLGEKLAAEAPAILAWIALGAADYMTGGLRPPGAVTTATADYAHDQDTVARFVDDACHLAPGQPAVKATASDVRHAYEQWCTENGETPVSAKRLGTDLRDRFGVTLDRSSRHRIYVGLGLATSDSEESREWYR